MTEFDRRTFIAVLAGTVATLALPPCRGYAADEWWEAGESVKMRLPDDIGLGGYKWPDLDDMRQMARGYLCDRAQRLLEPNTRFEIRVMPPTDFGRAQALAWYASSAMQRDSRAYPYEPPVPELRPELGIYEFGRYLA